MDRIPVFSLALLMLASCGDIRGAAIVEATPDPGGGEDTQPGPIGDADPSASDDPDPGTGDDPDPDTGDDSDPDTGDDSDPDTDDGAGDRARWTYLVYVAADNNLEDGYWWDLDELATAGSGNGVHVIAQVDRAEGYDTSNGDWTDTRRFYISEGHWDQIGEPLGEKNTGDPQTVSELLFWAEEHYPAEKYALVFWNHGDSWWSVADDSESGDTIEIARGELAEAFEAFVAAHGPVEAVMFDACLMASWEVAHALQGYVRYMSGSGSMTYDEGIDYKASIEAIKHNETATGRDLTVATAEAVRKISREKNSAAIDISRVGAVSNAIADLSSAVLADTSLESPLKEAISQARGLNSNWRMYYLDLRDLALKIEASSNSEIRPYGSALVEAIDAAVAIALGQTFSHDGATSFGGFNFMADYREDDKWLRIYADASWGSTGWGDVLRQLAN